MKKLTLFAIFIALFFSCQKEASQKPETLDLTKTYQQEDFKAYLSRTSELLQEPDLKRLFEGYDLKQLTEADKRVNSG